MIFKSLPELLDYFKDERTCIEYYEQIRWNGKPTCPHCGTAKSYKTNRGYKCSNSDCFRKFTVKVGTIFENSKIPFRIWFGAIFLATNHKKGISSLQLASDLAITQKTAWFVLHRIREMLKSNAPEMIGGKGAMVEADETYIGGKIANKHEDKIVRNADGSAVQNKKVVLGIIERDGKVVLKHITSASIKNMVPFIERTVQVGTKVVTDESNVYGNLGRNYSHHKVNHTLKVYVNGDAHTNTIENFWSVLKRGLYGIYHSVSEKHLERYLHEFSSRFNERKVSSQFRFEKFLIQSERRLKYKSLIA